MANYQLLNNVQHANLKVKVEHAAHLGDKVMFCMTFPFEFRLALAHYPIVIYQDPDKQILYPVTLFGLEDSENLFLNADGWDASYIPLMMQRTPFLIGYQQTSDNEEKQQVVTIDCDNPRINEQSGETLFNEQGGNSPYLEKVISMLDSIAEGHEQNQLLSQALQRHDLLEATTFTITLHDQSTKQLTGFSTVSEERFQSLNAAALDELNRSGLLIPITMMVASLSQFSALIKRRNII